MMIVGEIHYNDLCKNCDHAKLYLEEIPIENFNGDSSNLYFLHCKHEEVCEMWRNSKLFGESKDK